MMAHSPSERGGEKRERILDAAAAVFASRGFFQAPVSEIARTAGVADGTIYLYFKSKEEILISLFESRMARVNSALEAAVADETSPGKKLTAFIRTHLELVRDHPQLAEVLTVELRQSSKFMKEHPTHRFGDFLKLLASIISSGQDEKLFTSDVPASIAARAIFGMIDELALAWVLGGQEKFDIVRAADWVSSMILQGLERRHA